MMRKTTSPGTSVRPSESRRPPRGRPAESGHPRPADRCRSRRGPAGGFRPSPRCRRAPKKNIPPCQGAKENAPKARWAQGRGYPGSRVEKNIPIGFYSSVRIPPRAGAETMRKWAITVPVAPLPHRFFTDEDDHGQDPTYRDHAGRPASKNRAQRRDPVVSASRKRRSCGSSPTTASMAPATPIPSAPAPPRWWP